jgi:uncharacterized membrane protein
MRGIKIKKQAGSYTTHRLLTFLAVMLGILTTLLLFNSYSITSITGYNVLEELYGNLASMVLVLVIVVLIAIYLKLVEN